MNAIVNVNGTILYPEQIGEQAKVSVFDRSFLYGDSLYEVARTYQGRFFAMREHLDRLEKSASLCHLTLGQSLATYEAEMKKTLAPFHQRFPGEEAYCRLIVSRGIGRIGFGLECLESLTQYVIITQPLDTLTPSGFEKGRKLKVVSRLRNHPLALDPAMKSGNYLNSLLAYLEADREGFDDALMCNADGHITEGTTFSIGYVKRGVFVTSPLDIGILDSITRRYLLKIAHELGIETREVRFPKERLYDADEVISFSTTKEAYPVVQVDDQKIANGKPGPITRKLFKAFIELAEKTSSK